MSRGASTGAACAALLVACVATGALAQAPQGCAPIARGDSPLIELAAAKPGAGEIALTYVGHSTFVIETPAGVRAATDYNDYVRPSGTPDVATMNHAHSTHFSVRPDPAIKFVLRGWSSDGGKAVHDVVERDLRVRNVTTNIRDLSGGSEYDGNSIFIFEAAGLCIAHLGHLHHTLNPEQLGLIGHVDVVLAPVDGSWTLDQQGMAEVLTALRSPLVVPMHYFSRSTLDRFLSRLDGAWDIRRADEPTTIISRASLPTRPTILVLPGR